MEQSFARLPLVIHAMIDGVRCAVPFALALYLISHPYTDRAHLPVFEKARWHQYRVRMWDHAEEVVWPRAL